MSKKKCRSNIGGQAVLEGVMMRGESSMATAVRDENGVIQVESKRFKPAKEKSLIYRIPFLRGIINFGSTMYMGVGIIMRSSEVYEGEVEPTKFENWFAKKLHVNFMSVLMVFSVILGLALSIGLFFILPHFARTGIEALFPTLNPIWANLLEGLIRILIFVFYILLTSFMKEIKRVYMYHGAEHKTISCYEHGLELTIENVQKQSTVHDRCGTTFMFIVMVISVLFFSLTNFINDYNMWVKLAVKLALIPLIAGVSYEILKLLAKFDNWFVKILKFPGLLLQKLTTKQPTDDMVEVAITAFNTVYALDKDKTLQTTQFDTKILYKKVRPELDKILADIGEGNADADWITTHVLQIKRSEIENLTNIKYSQRDRMLELAKKRAQGVPLQQVLGTTDFYGIEITVTDKVLSPRPETEYLVEECIKLIKENKLSKVLDLCTGSGAIAIAVKLNSDNCNIDASDISTEALNIAKENARKNNADINFIESDLFEKIANKYDLIISNPPYIKSEDIENLQTEVKEHEPIIALDGGVDGLDFYRNIILNAKNFLNESGYLALEVGDGQSQDVAQLLGDNFSLVAIKKDLEQIERIVIAKVVSNV